MGSIIYKIDRRARDERTIGANTPPKPPPEFVVQTSLSGYVA